MRPHRKALFAAIFTLLCASHAAGAPVCKPDLTVADVMFSQIHRLQRVWSARILVDASRCASDHGNFEIKFVRLKETAPDMRFTEQFSWMPGVVVVATEFAADESVQAFSIAAPSCPCR